MGTEVCCRGNVHSIVVGLSSVLRSWDMNHIILTGSTGQHMASRNGLA